MQKLLKNPISTWLFRLLKAFILEVKHKKNKLKINGSSSANLCVFGQNNTIYEEVRLNEVSLGDFTYVAADTKISKTKIGKFCSIGPACRIGLGRHPSNTFVSTHPVFFSTLKQAQFTFADKNYFSEFEEINIGNDVWVGSNVIIVDGVTVSDGAIVAAGSVVTKYIPPYAIVAGVPAKIIKFRFNKAEVDELLKLKWWDMDIQHLEKNYKKFHDINSFFEGQNS